jgi:hypothetical protein
MAPLAIGFHGFSARHRAAGLAFVRSAADP